MKKNWNIRSLEIHERFAGKLETHSRIPVVNHDTLSVVYTPGVGAVSLAIAHDPSGARKYTWKGRTVAVVSDGSAVLGLGNIGPLAALPVMEGKCVLLKELAGIDAVPIVLGTQNTNEIVQTIRAIAPTYGAILLEDIAAPRCFEIEQRLQHGIDIPIIHDDQWGTAIVVLAGLINACRVTGRKLADTSISIIGAGAAGTAITKLLLAIGVIDIRVCDREGVLHKKRGMLPVHKAGLARTTNPLNIQGDVLAGISGCDIVIGVSGPNSITTEHIRVMNSNPIVFALANPVPEIMPDIALQSGAYIVATGRSDFPNQVNNAIVFPGLFAGLLQVPHIAITPNLMIAVAQSVARLVKNPTRACIIPDIFDPRLVPTIIRTIKRFSQQ